LVIPLKPGKLRSLLHQQLITQQLHTGEHLKGLAFKNWLPHEIIFAGFMIITLLRLILHAGLSVESTQLYLTCLLMTLTLIALCGRWPTITIWRLRLLIYPILIHILFINMRYAVPLFHSGHEDVLLLHADQWLIGGDLAVRLQHIATPLLTEYLTICYLLFFPYLLFCMISYGLGDLAIARKFYVGLFTIYGLGYTSYTFLPALGPYITLASQFSPLQGYWITHLETTYYHLGTNYADVFPSIHCAATAYILWFDRQCHPTRFNWLLFPVICLWFSTIYLRYHYFIDVVAGFLLAIFAMLIAGIYEKSSHKQNALVF
jgi:hypothetical protein